MVQNMFPICNPALNKNSARICIHGILFAIAGLTYLVFKLKAVVLFRM